MKISLKVTQPEKETQTCLIVGVYEGQKLTEAAKALDQATQNTISKMLKKGLFSAQISQTLPLFHVGSKSFEQILLVGCGKEGKLSAACYRKIIASAVKNLNYTKTTSAICYLTEVDVVKKTTAWKVKYLAEIINESLYCFDQFKSERQPVTALKEVIIHVSDNKQLKTCEEALDQGLAVADGVTLAKNLGNMPSNICTPTYLADQAKVMGKAYKNLSVKILEEKEMKKLGMGALLGVSQGSAEDAKLIVLEYKGGKSKDAPVALVGKGITFDTGGNSLKPADSMVGMKYDMCGAASVLGTFKAIAELQLPINVVGIIAAVENMPGGAAYKPEDILKSMSGQTIEVISTDAEGRLVLADALTYCERFKPAVVIDIATLTGAVVIALGFHATGLLSNDDKLAKDLLQAGEDCNDRAWQLPLWDEYHEQIKSPFADMANTGGRSAGTITAACFLSRFTQKFTWAHLDVAGTAAMMAGTHDRMATGRPVPMLTQYLIDRVK